MAKRVWVLGAGFSRSLGGPLLGDLLSYRSRMGLSFQFGNHPHLYKSDLSNAMYWLYDIGRHRALLPAPNITGDAEWEHAEQFLVFLDRAVQGDSVCRSTIEQALHASLPGEAKVADLDRIARQVIAAECVMFLRRLRDNDEAWSPYVTWKSTLRDDDVIISFNYDLVPERLGLVAPCSIDELARTATPVIKLHGSVSWQLNDLGERILILQHDDALVEGAKPLIATPGGSKLEVTKTLGFLWDFAKRALADAKEVRFVGYRFPPSDVFAYTELLSAIERNEHGPDIGIVLGPEPGADANRLLLVCQAITKSGGHVRHFSLAAEHFLPFWHVHRLR